MSHPTLCGEGLQRRFGAFEAVGGVHVHVDSGELVALLGPSGCGKTTVLQMLGLLDQPDSGRVPLDGVHTAQLGPRGMARLRLSSIGFVFQQHGLLDYLSARDNVALPVWRRTGDRRLALEQAEALLDRFGLAARARARARTLSPGEAQRVAVARAIVGRPRVLLADEPTGALDSASAQPVLEAIEAARDEGAAVLVVTHSAEVAQRATRVLRMRDGRLWEPEGR